MHKITLSLALVTMLLSACSNHKSITSADDSRVTANPAVQAKSETKVEPTSPVINQPIVIVEDQPIAPPIDLLERIRRGFQFPELESKYTANYIKWNVSHPSYLQDLFDRAEPFLYYIVEEIEKRGLPMELALLPAVESAFKPEALSRSKASGLWQFIPSTGKSFGLRQDWWYDGRRDFISSTNAALDYLTHLNGLFDGDWYLTLAAYNAGQGTVIRAVQANQRKGRKTDYQSLNLRAETVKYIPKLQALKEIVKNPSRYNVSLPKIPNQPYFEILTLPGQIDLQKFAELAKLDLKTIRHMNAGYLRWATSPEGPHRILSPISNHAQSSFALQKIEVNPSVEYQQHIIRRGENLGQIGRRFGVSVAALQKANNLSGTNIRAGKTLVIPIPSRTGSAVAQSNQNSANKRVHHVVQGDTLWSISKRYNVKLQQLLSWNQLSKNQTLRLNQSIFIFQN
ncbi:transglycosylase SLT domain-containing protein [Arenicella sp.]|nr:transglycosylase SLT domain-containing protein [Arenicella sp.]